MNLQFWSEFFWIIFPAPEALKSSNYKYFSASLALTIWAVRFLVFWIFLTIWVALQRGSDHRIKIHQFLFANFFLVKSWKPDIIAIAAGNIFYVFPQNLDHTFWVTEYGRYSHYPKSLVEPNQRESFVYTKNNLLSLTDHLYGVK